MKIDKKEFDTLMNKVDLRFDKKRIIDLKKYIYWQEKSSQYIDAMNDNRQDKRLYITNFDNAIESELEKNKYCHISKKEFVLLLLLLKYHNSISKNKIYMNRHGHKVKVDDRRAIRELTDQ